MKNCKRCNAYFTAYRTTDKYCYICSKTQKALKNLAKIKKEQVRKAKEDLLTTSDYIKLAQQVFNKWIRLRDKDQNCISCGSQLGRKFDAGHFWSAGGHANVRFNENNVHAQCVACNQHKHGNLLAYREALIKKIGIDRFNELENIAHVTKKWEKEELKEIIFFYKKKIKSDLY